MSQWGTDVLALVCITGGAVVGVGSLLALSGSPEHASFECSTVVESPRRVVVSVGGNESAVIVAPDLEIDAAFECQDVVFVDGLEIEYEQQVAESERERAIERVERVQERVERAHERAERAQERAVARVRRVERVHAEEVEERLLRVRERFEGLDVERIRLDRLREELEARGIDPDDMTIAVSVPDQSFEFDFEGLKGLEDFDLDLEGLEGLAFELQALENLDLELEGLDEQLEVEIAQRIEAELRKALERTRGGSGR